MVEYLLKLNFQCKTCLFLNTTTDRYERSCISFGPSLSVCLSIRRPVCPKLILNTSVRLSTERSICLAQIIFERRNSRFKDWNVFKPTTTTTTTTTTATTTTTTMKQSNLIQPHVTCVSLLVHQSVRPVSFSSISDENGMDREKVEDNSTDVARVHQMRLLHRHSLYHWLYSWLLIQRKQI